MILIDAIEPTDSYTYLCIHDLRCDPHEDDTHSRACQRVNDAERAEFYRDLLVEQVAERATRLANDAGFVMLDWQRGVLVDLWREQIAVESTGQALVVARPARCAPRDR